MSRDNDYTKARAIVTRASRERSAHQLKDRLHGSFTVCGYTSFVALFSLMVCYLINIIFVVDMFMLSLGFVNKCL